MRQEVMSFLRGLLLHWRGEGKIIALSSLTEKGEEEKAREKEYRDRCQFDQDACGVHIWASLRHSADCGDPHWTKSVVSC